MSGKKSGEIFEKSMDRLRMMQLHSEEFVRTAFRVEPTEQQLAVMRAYDEPDAHVSARSGHGTGKTTGLAWMIFHFLLFNADCRVPCTAPSAHQLHDVLWSECFKWYDRMHPWFRRNLILTKDHIMIRGHEKTRYAVARTAKAENPEALQGFHAEALLYVIDEASGVPEQIFETAMGALSTRGSKIVMMSNPTRVSGFFYDSQTRDREMWKCLTMSCLDCPLSDPKHARWVERKFGKDSNVYRVRVLGEFPTADADTLIPIDWVESAFDREIDAIGKRIAGLDVARFGDDSSAFVIRHGKVVVHAEERHKRDLMEICGLVVDQYRNKKSFDVVCVDVIGMGAGVVDRLNEIGIPVIGVNVAETSPLEPERFNRQRDELWWKCREFFENSGGSIRDFQLRDALLGELTCIKYGLTSLGKLKVEGKDEMKKRGLQSPNLADALCLTFTEGSMPALSRGPVEIQIESAEGWT